jgi:DNA invertase Pin-like site-specific DNA recombinase
VILRADGTVEYLKTYRLSRAQTRRAYLLSQLATHGWNLSITAEALNQTSDELVLRLENAGFGYLLNNMLREQVQARQRRSKR